MECIVNEGFLGEENRSLNDTELIDQNYRVYRAKILRYTKNIIFVARSRRSGRLSPTGGVRRNRDRHR